MTDEEFFNAMWRAQLWAFCHYWWVWALILAAFIFSAVREWYLKRFANRRKNHG